MHPLEVILQLQLGSDQAAVLSLPSILSALTPAHFGASPHLPKWIARVSTLMHSKHPGARWAGLCLVLQTSALNKDLMVQSAQAWIGYTLPMLSRNEVPPTWKASIRLLDYIFTSTVGMPEFQRQLAMPNVPKFSAALISLAEKGEEPGVRHVALVALTRLVPLYPTLHRTLHPSLHSFSLRLLSGSSTSPTPSVVINDACNLHAVLHSTGGKVGAAPLWRKSLDIALANAWFSFGALRTTFPPLPRSTVGVQPTLEDLPTDPVVSIPLSLDRLKCAINLIQKLLTSVTLRPVPVPVGELVKLALHLLHCIPGEADESHPDASRRALEVSVVHDIWKLGCEFVIQLARSIRHYLNPHLSRIVIIVTHHLEQPLPRSQHIPFLRLIPLLLDQTHALHTPIPPTRLVKAILSRLTVLLTSKAEVQQQLQHSSTAASKKGKRRAHTYEGDEVFRVGREVLCPTGEDGEAVLAALDALDPLLANPHLDAPVRTLAARLLVTLVLELPRHPPATLSPDLALHGRLHARVLSLCSTHLLAGSGGWVNSAVGLVVKAVNEASEGSETIMNAAREAQRALDVLLHPRLPPLLRMHPPLEAVALLRSESVKKDEEVREALGMGIMEDVLKDKAVATNDTATTAERVAATERVALATVARSQSQSTDHPEVTAIPVTTISTAAPPETMSNLPIMAQMSAQSSTITEEHPSRWKPSPVSVPVQQETAVASTSSQVFKTIQYEDSEDEDEEMPEIDMRSDSE